MQSIDSGAGPRNGVFITLEGPDGAGKSSQQTLLVERIRSLGRDVVSTREPGSTTLGERVRTILMESEDSPTGHDPIVDALLFNAARRVLVREVMRPALERGAVVVCDRYADSTLAYQGYGGGGPLDSLRALAAFATDGLMPRRTVLLDLSVDAGLARRFGGDPAELTRFETDATFDPAFHERVRNGYLEMAAAEPERWRVVDASRPPDELADEIWGAIRDLFGG